MRVRRLVKRVLLGLLALIVVVVVGGLVFVHTPPGRAFLRGQVEARMNDAFAGGASLGGVEGSPFGKLVLLDVVINGPDGKPAITIGRLTLKVGILPLLSHQARILGLVAEDVDVDLRRDANGELQIAHLLKPGPKTPWSVHIPDIVVSRARIAYDTGTEVVHLDDVMLTAALKMPVDGPLDASTSVRATWRERGDLPLAIETAVHVEDGETAIPALVAKAGDVHVAAANVRITEGPVFRGAIAVSAPRAAVTRLAPELDLPGDLQLVASALPNGTATHVELDAWMGGDTVHAIVDADLVNRRASGMVSTSELDLGRLTRGRLDASGAGLVTFAVEPPAPGELPRGSVIGFAVGTYADLPRSRLTIGAMSDGVRVTAQIGASSPSFTASIHAAAKKIGSAITLESGTLVATTRDPVAASGGLAPVRGALHANLTASGTLAPNLDLAVAGRVDGSNLRAAGTRVDTLTLAIDARRIPARPLGRLQLDATGITRGDVVLRDLALTAANREDGKIAVALRTRPKQDPWLLEADALVTLGDVVTIDLERHRLRAGTGTDWAGTTGRVAISKRRIELRDFTSASPDGAIAVEGNFLRRSGDLDAKLDVTDFHIATLSQGYTGTLTAHVDVTRRAGRLAGDAEVHAKGVGIDPKVGAIDADATLHAQAGALTLAAKAGSATLGSAQLAFDIDAPADVGDANAWKRLGRSAIRTARLTFEKLDVANAAKVAGLEGDYRGRVDGDIRVSALTTGGVVTLRGLMTPALLAIGEVNADLNISQSAPDELTPSLAARVDGIGGIQANAKLGMPDRVFDPAAWAKLGRGALRGAWLRADNIAIDPAQLDRLGITTWARGTASVAGELGAGAADAKLGLALRTLRGSPISQPIDADLVAVIDGNGAKATVEVRTREHRMVGKREVPVGPSVRLLCATSAIPLTMTELLHDPQSALAEPLIASAKLPNVPAKHVLAVFGRTEVTGGTLAGTIDVAGTVGRPTAKVHVVGSGIAVPPGAGGRPIKTIRELVVDATWDGKAGKLVVDGTQDSNGTLHLEAAGSPDVLADATVALTAKQFDMQPVLVFAPGPAGGAAGRLDANVKLRGLDPKTARLSGELHVQRGRLPIAPEVGTLRRAKIDVVIGEREMTIGVDGRIGRGTVAVRGKIAMAGALPTGGEATVTLRKMSPIGVVEPSIDADATVKLHRETDRWVADIGVRHGNVVVPDSRNIELSKPGAPPDMVFVTGERITRRPREIRPPARPTFVANITIAPTYVKSEEMTGIVKGKLTITVDGDQIGITGTIDTDRGDLDLFGRRYQVERAAVRFDGGLDPLLDVRITHDFNEVTTTTVVRGRLSKPEIMMSSSPATYSQAQLLGFLLGGEPGGEPQGDARDRASSAGASYVANQIGGYVKKQLPIDLDVLRYESATASSSAAVTVGTWLTRSVFLAYRQRLEARPDENSGEAEVEYWLTKRLRVEGVIGDRNYDGVDLVWRKRY